MIRTLASIAVACSLLAAPAAARAEEHGKATFLLTSTHTPEQCLSALDTMAAKNQKLLSKMEWGCKSGDHSGYAFVEAADEKAAIAMLPEEGRANAKATKVTKFTPQMLKDIHKQMGK